MGAGVGGLSGSYCEYATVDSSASASCRESRRVCWTTMGTSDSMTLE